MLHLIIFLFGIVLTDNALLIPLQLCQYALMSPNWKSDTLTECLEVVLFEKYWNVKRHAPLFRLHKLLKPTFFGLTLTKEENSQLDSYWDEEVDKDYKMYWSFSSSKF